MFSSKHNDFFAPGKRSIYYTENSGLQTFSKTIGDMLKHESDTFATYADYTC